jgi:hypothetical protein
MSEHPVHHDLDIVLHALLAAGLVAADAFIILFLVPEMFDQHSTELDLAALLAICGALAFSYLAGRHLWRSIQHIIDGEDK